MKRESEMIPTFGSWTVREAMPMSNGVRHKRTGAWRWFVRPALACSLSACVRIECGATTVWRGSETDESPTA
jgi:hypothetical protein